MKLQLYLELARGKKCCYAREGKKDFAQGSKIPICISGIDCNPDNTRKSKECLKKMHTGFIFLLAFYWTFVFFIMLIKK